MNSRAFISFLDVAACGMGAAILLFVIGVELLTSEKDNITKDAFIIRCEQTGGSPAPIGIEYLKPNGGGWQNAELHLQPAEGIIFASQANEKNGLISMMILYTPELGEWQFRPILLGTPYDGTNCNIRMLVSGKGVNESADSSLINPLDKGTIVKAVVRK